MPRLQQVFVLVLSCLSITLLAQSEYGGVPTYLQELDIKSSVDESSPIAIDHDIARRLKANDVSENILALPILTDLSAKKKLNFFKSNETSTVFHQKIGIGAGTESYIRLADYHLPKGARLYIIGDDGAQIKGAYTRANNKETGNFMVGPVRGDIIVEYNSPTPIRPDQLPFKIDQIYTGVTDYGAMETGYGTSFDCMINVNCDEGRGFGEEKRGVVRIRIVGEEGIALCTGSLMNNTAEDQTPYVLSAFHCIEPVGIDFTPLYDMWYFDFNYEGNSCATPDTEPDFVTVQGAEKLAEWQNTDMLLVRITAPIPIEANAYFNGWDIREDYLPAESVMIHHPNGDIKKISRDVDTLRLDVTDRAWDNGFVSPALSHVRSEFDEATYQPGSSGAPLFDDKGRVVGQLHGGPRSDEFCTIAIAYSGRLSESWDAGDGPESRLRDWLDPLDEGGKILDGLESDSQAQLVKFNGRVITADGIAISNVAVSLKGDQDFEFYTGADGRFVFDNLSTKGNFTFALSKDENVANGLSSIDLVMITNHILGRAELGNVFQRYAADVSADGRISGLDLIQITNAILGRTESYPNSPSWKFEPEVLQMSGGDISSTSVELVVIGFKMGDVNYSANPRR